MKGKTGGNTVATHSDTKRNILGGSLSTLLFCVALIQLTKALNRADCGYQVHGTERKISHLMYMNDLELLGRSEDDLENEVKNCQSN